MMINTDWPSYNGFMRDINENNTKSVSDIKCKIFTIKKYLATPDAGFF